MSTGNLRNVWYGLSYDAQMVLAPFGLYPSFSFTGDDTAIIIWAVGKWHLEAHVPECHVAFSTNFIHGAGQVDGERLETRWAELDRMAPSTRSMGASHRRDTLDAFLNFGNFEKMVHSGMACLH